MKVGFACLFLLSSLFGWAQSAYLDEIKNWQNELNAEYANPEKSPLPAKELKRFKSLDFFEINPDYRVVAELVRTPDSQPFSMPTTTERTPIYQQYGVARFQLQGKTLELPVYQNHALSLKTGYEDYLFLPFTDPTNGFESYGGGRYLDVRIPTGDTLVIDFNKAYNPYCAYNTGYSCPIPPKANDLPIEIKAGVKAWKDH